MHLTANELTALSKPKRFIGVCHQLAAAVINHQRRSKRSTLICSSIGRDVALHKSDNLGSNPAANVNLKGFTKTTQKVFWLT